MNDLIPTQKTVVSAPEHRKMSIRTVRIVI